MSASTQSEKFNPRDAKELEQFLVYKSYPPYDVQWVDCGLEAISLIDDGKGDSWMDLPVPGHQMTAKDIVRFLHIDHLL